MRTVTVSGHGAATAHPDSAVVRVAAVHRGATLTDALAGASSAGDTAVAVARGHVAASSVGTVELAVWPAHDEQGRPAGFEARHGYRIACDSLEVAGTLVGELATQVGDRLQVEGVTLEISDSSVALAAAREAAYADALARAEHLAALAGVTLGDVQAIVEGAVAGLSAQTGEVGAAYSSRLDLTFEPGRSSLAQALTVTWAVV
ncbi:SIMPL domain-containing protein [Nocardioides sp. cx-173]|uniref:SIMPL domain-containing protein n=1 Tax=Nocardioides sp. cx-173 TaxID=2898796 RepID=UPI001E4A0082|nr:SIMPL domain-containing protein [Nocardioides sp. cx-173]MCD4526305.1 SIMPL domain-containing protein [Nocardioides sp. cx-173]UGB43481.1 SIMPL domain-containing protein [Nocardioides sp. cx-173]